MLRRFKVEGYRNVSADVALEACTVVIGPNNSGKSNLMRAMRFATDGVVGAAWNDVVREHGGPAMPRWGQALDRVRWCWTFDDPAQGVEARLEETVGVWELVIQRADLGEPQLASASEWEGWWLNNLTDAMLAEVDVAPDRQPSKRSLAALRTHFSSLCHLQLGALHAPTAKAASMSVRGASRLATDASNLVAWLKEQQNHAEGLDAVRQALEPLIPGLKRLFVKDVDGQAMWVELALAARAGHAVPLSDLSDGTLVALILASLLHGPLGPRVLLLDEPDLHLHPAWIRAIAAWFEQPPAGRQVILATHSSDLLDALTPGFKAGRVALLVAGVDGVVKRASPDRFTAFFEEGYELGDLYRVGEPELGGWPW
jgi:predicted ATPase